MMGAGYLNTCKHRDSSIAECDVWEFEAHPIMLRGDDTDALFGAADCALWGQEADRLLMLGNPKRDRPELGMVALYDFWFETIPRSDGGDDCSQGAEFVGWVKWSQVVAFAETIAVQGPKS